MAKLTPIDLVAAPKKKGKKPKSWKEVERRAAKEKVLREKPQPKKLKKLSGEGPKLGKKKVKEAKRKGQSQALKNTQRLISKPATKPTKKLTKVKLKGGGEKTSVSEKALTALDKVYEAGDKALKSDIGRVLMDPAAMKNSPGEEAKRKALKKTVEGGAKAVKEGKKVVRKVQIAKGKAEKVPVAGQGVKAATFLPEQAGEAGWKLVKGAWYSPNAIRGGLAGKNIPKHLSGKEKTSGRELATKAGVDPKKHKGANILLGGAAELASEVPLAAATGGSGTVAKMAGEQAGKKALKEATKQALKEAGGRRAGKKKLGDLPKAKRENVRRKQGVAAENAEAQASAKYGRQRELYAGVDIRVPFSKGRRIQKLVPVTRPVTKARAQARRKLDAKETKLTGTRRGKVLTKVRNAPNVVNIKVNAGAKPRNISEYEARRFEEAGVEKRARDANVERDANDLYRALTKDVPKGADPRPMIVKIEAEIEKLGPKADSPKARALFAAQDRAYAEMTRRGLASEWGGQKLVKWDYNRLGNRTAKGRSDVNTQAKLARADVKTAKKQAKAEVKEPKIGASPTTTARTDERVAGARERKAKMYDKAEALHARRVDAAQKELDKVSTSLKNMAARPNTPANRAAVESLTARRTALLTERRQAKASQKAAAREASKARRSATQARREVSKVNVKAAQERAKEKSINVKKHDALKAELKAAPATNDLAETQATLESFAKRFEALGDRKTARNLRMESAKKAEEPPFHTPRRRLVAEQALDAPPKVIRNLTKTKSRRMRTLKVEEAAAQKEGKQYDFTPEGVVKDIKGNRMTASEAQYWDDISRTIRDQGDKPGNLWYAITSGGISEGKMLKEDAVRAAEEWGGKAVRLDGTTRKMLERKAQLHHSDFTGNAITRGARRGVGGWKRFAILTPTNYMRNLFGDTSRSIALGRAGAAHTKDAAKIANLEMKRQKLERTAARFADDVNPRGHRVTNEKLNEAFDSTITIGSGQTAEKRTVGELVDEMSDEGILESGMIRSDVLTGSPTSGQVRKAGPLERADRTVSARELFSRSHLYLNARSQGLTQKQAGELVRKVLFDYGDVSEFEEAARRFVIPFIVFKGRNLATWAGHIVRKPGKVQQYLTVFDTLSQLAGYEDFQAFEKDAGKVAQQLAIPIPKSLQVFGINAVNPTLPLGDLYNTYRQLTNKNDALTAVGQQVFAIKIFANLAPRAAFGKPTDTNSKEIPGPLYAALKKAGLGSLLRLSVKENFEGEKRPHAHPIVYDIIGLNPETGTTQRALTEGQDWWTPVTNFLSGLGAQKIKPGTGELQRVRAQLDNIEISIKDAPNAAVRNKLYAQRELLRDYRDSLYAKQGAKWAKTQGGGGGGGGSGFGSGSSNFGAGGFGSGASNFGK